MSFSSDAKNEICSVENSNCCSKAELSALFHMAGSIKFEGKGKVGFYFKTENAAIARRCFKMLKSVYGITARVVVTKSKQFKTRNVYSVIVSSKEKALEILLDLSVLKKEGKYLDINYHISKNILENNCCKRALLRGAFLGGGSISDPGKAYHLEFISNNSAYAAQLIELIGEYGLKGKQIQRKNNTVVYLKEADQIVTILNIIGAHKTLLDLENIRIMKEMRNNVNRIVNCETANLSKTVEAAHRQIKIIEYLRDKVGLDKLPKKLRDVAEVRLNYPQSSLRELGEKLDPPVGKSGINHRLKRLEKLAKEAGYEE